MQIKCDIYSTGDENNDVHNAPFKLGRVYSFPETQGEV